MELISQHTKAIMEGCKERARAAGLRFDAESLEYIVTNRDLLELTPKAMIPTLYDYWVHDVEVLREKGRYELYPNNPYETVINTRPAISFYNDNNPDWLNVMIFYHVLAHIDFFQNNLFFRHTWDFDLAGQALADKRLIARLRAEKGRWVDYIIEFARGIDNLVGYHRELSRQHRSRATQTSARLDYYFDVFLQTERKLRPSDYLAEITRYNDCLKKYGKEVERYFFAEVLTRHPEFDSLYDKSLQQHDSETKDLLQFLLDHSPMLQREENKWMKSVIDVVRKTSLYFQPQIRTKIMNEGWASYWHEKLFLQDERIKGHEIEFARIHAGVTSLQRVGLNPYAVGLRMFQSIEDAANKGRFDDRYRRLQNARARRDYDAATGNGLATIFRVREDYADFTFVNEFVDQEFVDRHKLFVVGRRLNEARMVWEYYVKSRSAEAYRQMLMANIYHPPAISVDRERTAKGPLYLNHRFEKRPLVQEFIGNTLIGIEYLWGGSVQLETSEVARISRPEAKPGRSEPPAEITWRRVIYQSAQRKLTKVPA